MRITSALIIAVALCIGAGSAQAQRTTAVSPAQPASAQAALERGLGAFRAGKHESAVSALSSAAAMGDPTARFIAEFYLARMYGENAGPVTDHTKAFVLYRKLADEHLDVDPIASQRAPFVAKALIALAGYVRSGIKEIDLGPSPRRANDYLHHAAVFFGDRDAQLELARAYLGPDSSGDDVRRGLHYLAVLSEESHGPAQAVLADLFWRGRHVARDERRALALLTMAVENAPTPERIWIEEGYATTFCGVNQITRAEAGVLVAKWRQTFVRPAGGPVARTGAFEFLPERQCASGERVALGGGGSAPAAAAKADAPAASPSQAAASPPRPITAGALSGAPTAGFRAAGIIEKTTKK